MSKGQKVKIKYFKDGGVVRIQYTSYGISKKCEDRKMDMWFCKMDGKYPHFVYSPQFAMQFQSEKDAEEFIYLCKIKNCTIKILSEMQTDNVYNPENPVMKHTIINP